jgi:hypothetical protein
MLIRQNGTSFTTGRSRFADQQEGAQEQTAKLFVRIEPERLGGIILAQLDTGAAWSILDTQVADALALLNGAGEPKPLSTRIGTFNGRLERTRIDIVADEGDSLSVEATVWVSPEWPGGNFLGYGGLLERICFAVDPSDNSFHFGAV